MHETRGAQFIQLPALPYWNLFRLPGSNHSHTAAYKIFSSGEGVPEPVALPKSNLRQGKLCKAGARQTVWQEFSYLGSWKLLPASKQRGSSVLINRKSMRRRFMLHFIPKPLSGSRILKRVTTWGGGGVFVKEEVVLPFLQRTTQPPQASSPRW